MPKQTPEGRQGKAQKVNAAPGALGAAFGSLEPENLAITDILTQPATFVNLNATQETTRGFAAHFLRVCTNPAAPCAHAEHMGAGTE
jgi:hypothetical protein